LDESVIHPMNDRRLARDRPEQLWALGPLFCSAASLSPEAPLSPLSSRPKRSVVERSLCGCSFLEVFFLQSVPRISYSAMLAMTRCGSPQREPHAIDQRHRSRQETPGGRSGGAAVFPATHTPSLAHEVRLSCPVPIFSAACSAA
jgi:hypothetical protein